MKILAIDPGLSGAIALTDGLAVEVWDMPVDEVKYKNGSRLEVQPGLLYELADYARRDWGVENAVIEHVTASPLMGPTSAFRFGEAFGIAHACCQCAGLTVHLVKPAQWKNALRLGRDKNVSREVASRLFPNAAKQFARAKDDGRAEAALLGWWWLNRKTK